MAAPAGLSSGSVPEPAAQTTAEPEADVPEAADATEPVLTEAGPVLTEAEPQAAEPEAAEPVLAEPVLAEPEPELGDPPEQARRKRGVRLLTVAGVVIAAIALVGAAVAVLAVVTHGFRPKTVVTYRPAAVFGLRAGECLNSSPNGLSVTIRSCATPHDAEAFATFRLAGSSWPGSAAIRQEASDGCASRVGAYLNPQLADAGLTQEYVFPDQQAWQAGVRTVVCEIRASGGQLSGSVRQPG